MTTNAPYSDALAIVTYFQLKCNRKIWPAQRSNIAAVKLSVDFLIHGLYNIVCFTALWPKGETDQPYGKPSKAASHFQKLRPEMGVPVDPLHPEPSGCDLPVRHYLHAVLTLGHCGHP